MTTPSAVLHFPPATAGQSEIWLRAKLACYADAWDLAQDLAAGVEEIVVLDVRSVEQYQKGHICGAVSFPHRMMTADTLAALDREKVYITYCDGIGCNGSTKGAWKLTAAGYQVKELIGGLDFWLRDQHPVTQGEAAGEWPAESTLNDCGC
ncbi:rhodanese-like domain-containing protein [Erwinia pyri]|uniref:Rhodanese-like domain-containing protein n=1 Tax=Erwinia pyri TaxID=3062598 RepID=A0AA50DLC9_9GAMM|nr:rhodanese-like domain-containing protein [Erwinia sp. DE2]WLS80129.1 rhodanese-like domain-containing protein [Erwinia sp. DE2]